MSKEIVNLDFLDFSFVRTLQAPSSTWMRGTGCVRACSAACKETVRTWLALSLRRVLPDEEY